VNIGQYALIFSLLDQCNASIVCYPASYTTVSHIVATFVEFITNMGVFVHVVAIFKNNVSIANML